MFSAAYLLGLEYIELITRLKLHYFKNSEMLMLIRSFVMQYGQTIALIRIQP